MYREALADVMSKVTLNEAGVGGVLGGLAYTVYPIQDNHVDMTNK